MGFSSAYEPVRSLSALVSTELLLELPRVFLDLEVDFEVLLEVLSVLSELNEVLPEVFLVLGLESRDVGGAGILFLSSSSWFFSCS